MEIKSNEFTYQYKDYPHVTREAVDMANVNVLQFTPNGAMRFLDKANGVDPLVTDKREEENPPPESEKKRPTVKTSQYVPHKKGEVTPDETDRIGRVVNKKKISDTVDAVNDETLEKGDELDADGDVKKKDKEFLSALDLYEIGLMEINKQMPGLKIVFTGQGSRGGFEFGLQDAYPKIRGINVPSGTSIFKTLKKFSRTMFTVFSEIQNEQARDFWLPLISGYGAGSAISRMAPEVDCIPTTKDISIDGDIAFKMIPPLEWFDEKIREIDPIKHLLAIFPEAEASTFLLHLGRLAFGKHTGQEIVPCIKNFPIVPEFNYRTACVLNGAPMIGKSTLMDEILSAIKMVGYTATLLSSEPGRFSWNGVVNDLIYADDTTVDVLKNLLKSSNLKSIISGNPIKTEVKLCPEMDAYPRCVTIFSANDVVIPGDSDPGMLQRTHFLTTYTHNQLRSKSTDENVNLFTGDYWTKKARELKVDKAALALYLVSSGLRKFIEEIGVSQHEDGTWIQDPDKVTLTSTLEQNRKRYRFKTPVNPKSSVTSICRKGHILASIFGAQEIPAEYNEGFSGFTLLHTARVLLRISNIFKVLDTKLNKIGAKSDLITPIKKEFFSEIKEWMMPSDEVVISEMIWSQYLAVWRSSVGRDRPSDENDYFVIGDNKKTQFEDIFRTMIKVMTDIHGNTIEQERSVWAHEFSRAKGDTESYTKGLTTILEKYEDRIDFENDAECLALGENFFAFRSINSI